MTITINDVEQHEFVSIKELRERLGDLKPSFQPEYFLHDLHLLRFIRARKSVDKAEVMYRKFVEWLEEVEFAKATSFAIREEVAENFTWKVTGLDKYGGPVVVVPIGQWDLNKTKDVTCDELVKLAIRSLSQLVSIAVKQCEEKSIAVQATGVADLKGLSLRHVTHVEGLKATLTVIKFFEACFPECLRIVYVLNAPYVFSMAWRLIKPLITGSTHEKIRFVYSNYENEIKEFVDPENLPVSYGGTLPDDAELLCDGKEFQLVTQNANCDEEIMKSQVKNNKKNKKSAKISKKKSNDSIISNGHTLVEP